MKQVELLGGLMGDGSVWRMRSLMERGIAGVTVRRALAAGVLEQVSWGTYRLAAASRKPDQELAELSARVPKALVCLSSAAVLHGLGDVMPAKVWAALPHRHNIPSINWPPTRFVRWSVASRFSVGIEHRTIAGIPVALTDLPRTVVDMIACKNLVGEDRAHQCLRDYVGQGEPLAALSAIASQIGWQPRVAPYLLGAAVFAGPR